MAHVSRPLHRREIAYVQFFQAFEELKNAWSAWRVYVNTRKELNNLSDRELEDIGLSRGSIEMIAYQTAYRKAKV